jgi:hypothetical protein
MVIWERSLYRVAAKFFPGIVQSLSLALEEAAARRAHAFDGAGSAPGNAAVSVNDAANRRR